MANRNPTGLQLKAKAQASEDVFKSKMKAASDRQFSNVNRYYQVVLKPCGRVVHDRMSMSEFISWAGSAARSYELRPI